MPWSNPISERIVARIRALLPGDWKSRAGDRFRKTTQTISDFAEEHHITPAELLGDGVDLGRRKLEGLASHEYAEALKNFAEEEKIRTEIELNRRSMEAELKRKEAEARLAEISTVNAEIELLQKLKEAGIALHRDSRGTLTALPTPPEFDLLTILDSKQIAAGTLEEGVTIETDGVHVRGHIKAPTISYPTERVIIEAGAKVQGDLHAHTVVIRAEAEVVGDVWASDMIDVKALGKLEGDAHAARIAIEDGAFFKGGIDIKKPD
jgi:cytoskeletal protein CcmA (bactofilin family)